MMISRDLAEAIPGILAIVVGSVGIVLVRVEQAKRARKSREQAAE